jgi:hypothetical protein
MKMSSRSSMWWRLLAWALLVMAVPTPSLVVRLNRGPVAAAAGVTAVGTKKRKSPPINSHSSLIAVPSAATVPQRVLLPLKRAVKIPPALVGAVAATAKQVEAVQAEALLQKLTQKERLAAEQGVQAVVAAAAVVAVVAAAAVKMKVRR